MRPFFVGGLLFSVVLAVLPSAAVADTVDVAPLRTFTTPAGYEIAGMSRDGVTGRVFLSGDDGRIHVFSGQATGAATELFTLGSGAGDLRGNAVSLSGDIVYVANRVSNAVDVYQGGTSSPVLVQQSVTTGVSTPQGVAAGPGRLLYVTNLGDDSVNAYDLGTSSGYTRKLTGPLTSIIQPVAVTAAVDGTLYVANNAPGPDTVTVFAPSANGNTPPERVITLPPDMTEPRGLALDSAGNLYVATFDGGVAVYSPGAGAGSTPTRRLTGASTDLAGTVGLALDGGHQVFTAQLSPGRVQTFAPLTPPPFSMPHCCSGARVATRTTVTSPSKVTRGKSAKVCAAVTVRVGTGTVTGSLTFGVRRIGSSTTTFTTVVYSGGEACITTAGLKKKGGREVAVAYSAHVNSVFTDSTGVGKFKVVKERHHH